MNLKDIDKKLDMEMEIMISDSADIFRWSKLHDLNISLFIKQGSQGTKDFYFEAFIIKDQKKPSIQELIEAYNPVDMGGFYIVARPIINKKILRFIRELCGVPSTIFARMAIEGGKLILIIRYHSAYKKAVSLILNKYLSIPYFIDDIRMAKTEGVICFLDKKNKSTPLSIIQYSVPLSIHKLDYPSKMIMDNNAIGEVAENPYNPSKFVVFVFSGRPIEEKENFKCLSKEDMIYETFATNKLLNNIREKANARGISRNPITVKIKDGRIYSTSVISSNRMLEYMQIVFSSSQDPYEKNMVRIENSTDFDSTIYGEL
jgi:hypothetical protein